ncbi:sulfur carrier protein ThiS [Metallumcola ferriviriculae]|uniref:Sulfur carrier protein ThiS n=1 Tax=Metallumcola ferriviriculae TaxID=3039180 RepID=A0AAU0UKK5_9FIRM|nr:sulfur carrier protein ThiS [Desulfitibacteraceae bacterium MK1]
MIVNGKEMNIPSGTTISALLKKLKINAERVVVQVNQEIISAQRFEKVILDAEDKIEIISFVGGG